MSIRSWRPTTATGKRRRGRAFWVAGLTLGLGIALPGIAFADAGKPTAVNVVTNGLTVTLSGTWSWPEKTMPCGPGTATNRSAGWAADWGDGFAGNFVRAFGQASNVGYHMGTSSDNTVRVSSANGDRGDCGTGSSGAAFGTFQGLSHTYASEGTYTACVVIYDVRYDTDHGAIVLKDSSELKAGGTGHNTDNSAEKQSVEASRCKPVTFTLELPVKKLTLVKTADEASYDEAGDVLHYSFKVTNTGNQPLTGPVVVADDKAADEACPAVTTVGDHDNVLDPDEFVVCTATHTVTQANLNAGSVTNTASASADGTTSNEDSVTVDADQNPEVTLVKKADVASYDAVDDVIHYTFKVINSGNISLAGPVTIDDAKADDLSCPAVSTVGDNDGDLDPGEFVTCTGDHTVIQTNLNAGSFTNTATATVDSVESNEDSVKVDAVQDKELTLVKDADEASFNEVGDVIHYTFTITNTGNISLDGPVTITDDTTSDESCPAVDTVGDNDSRLDPGESIECAATHTITQVNLNNGDLTNTATAGAVGVTSNEDSVTTDGIQNKALALVKNVDKAIYDEVGETLGYTFMVSNTGNVSLDGPVTIQDDKTTNESCPAVTTVGDNDGTLDPGEEIVCTASKTVTRAMMLAGRFTNTATAKAGGTTSDPDSATSDAVLAIQVVLDASASIIAQTQNTITTYNAFLNTWQNKAPGQPYSLTLFNTRMYRERYIDRNIDTVPNLTTNTFYAGGKTPLYDSVTRAINTLAARNPTGQVIFVIRTDGADNASTTSTLSSVRALINKKINNAGWIFVYSDYRFTN